MLTTAKKSKIVMPTAREDAAITAAAMADPDAQPLSVRQLKAMVPMRSIRGRPKSSNNKVLVSIRYSQDVLMYFKSLGDGWQSSMNDALQRYVAKRKRVGA